MTLETPKWSFFQVYLSFPRGIPLVTITQQDPKHRAKPFFGAVTSRSPDRSGGTPATLEHSEPGEFSQVGIRFLNFKPTLKK